MYHVLYTIYHIFHIIYHLHHIRALDLWREICGTSAGLPVALLGEAAQDLRSGK